MARKRKVVAAAQDDGGDDPFAPEVAPPLNSDVPAELLEIVGGMKEWQPASEVLVNVRSIPSRFLGMDRALGLGAFPLGRMYVVHGPSGQGKTSFELGIIRSFLEGGNLAALIDAEHTTTIKWVDDMLRRFSRSPLFLGKRPRTYEETIDGVDEILKLIPRMKEVKPDLATVIVVDSLNKLTPERELAQMRKDAGDAIDKGWGRVRAGMNQAWIDHLTPLLGALDVVIVFIAQERTKKDAGPDDFKYGTEWEIKGGKGVIYDSSLVMRVTRAAWIKESDAEKAPVIGTRHRVRVHKSKVEWLGKSVDFHFHVVNGADGTPAGYDFGRDLLEVGKAVGAFEQSGGWIRWGGHKWNGEDRFLAAVRAGDAEWLRDAEADVRSRFERAEGIV